MEKQFLPFNDYLGLSSIFTQSQQNDPTPVNEEQVKKVTKAVSDAWIDKRIEEILHQYSLKVSLQNSCINQLRQPSPQKNFSDNITANAFNLNSTNQGIWSASFVQSENADLNSFNSGLIAGSVTSSPLTPNSGSWLSSAASTTAVSSPTTIKPAQSFTASAYDLNSLSNIDQQSFGASSTLTNNFLVSSESQPLTVAAANQKLNRRNNSGCSFCRNNKEVDDWVMSHQLKDSLNRVVCPILRSYVCPLCFASGDNAHTLGHCPLNPDKKNSSLPLAVRRRTNATGKVKM